MKSKVVKSKVVKSKVVKSEVAKNNIAVIGASGALGQAFLNRLSSEPENDVYAFSRSPQKTNAVNITTGHLDYDNESTIESAAMLACEKAALDLVLVATGILHDDGMQPEKSLRQLSPSNFDKNFLVNTIGPALVAKHFLPKLNSKKQSVFAVLSARVGSISDNRLGGWYAYRASKAALNMVIKTASIEIARKNPSAVVVGLHPGTVASELSKPFQARVPQGKLFDADYSVKHLMSVIETLTPKDTGKIFAWDGKEITA